MTYEKACSIVEQNPAFYKTERKVQEVEVHLFDYRYATHNDFVQYDAFELRGLCFIRDGDDKAWVKNIALRKFFNINQNDMWMYDDVKDKKILSVQDKLDGSMISFVKINGKFVAKSKMSFESEQAKMAQEIFDNDKNIQELVLRLDSIDSTPIFELTSPKNQIVLPYNDSKLTLLQIRDENGSYYTNVKEVAETYGVPCAEVIEGLTLDDLMELKKTEKDIEGWIVTFEDGQQAKIKTDWYLALHGLVGDDSMEHNLIKVILDDEIDDVLSQLSPSEKRTHIEETIEKVSKEFSRLILKVTDLHYKFIYFFKENKKDFALEYLNNEVFGMVMNISKKEEPSINDYAKLVKEHILKRTNSLSSAREFLEGIK